MTPSDSINITGEPTNDSPGDSMDAVNSVAGVNGDGLDDCISGASYYDDGYGEGWIVYGNAGPGNLRAGALSTTDGVEFYASSYDSASSSIAGPDDMHGDDFHDPTEESSRIEADGGTYVIYGGPAQ